MPWLDVIKGFLSAFASLIKDIPVWAKSILVFGIFAVLTVVLLANLHQLIVYEVEVLENARGGAARQYTIEHLTTGRQSRTDDSGYTKLLLPITLFTPQRNEMIVRKPVVNVGEAPPRLRFRFSSNVWQSAIVPFSIVCDFDRSACELERPGDYPDVEQIEGRTGKSLWESIVGVVQAQSLPPAGVAVPTLETLVHFARDSGYTEIRLSGLQLTRSYCEGPGRCPASLYADVEWNGVKLLFDGIEGASSDRSLTVNEKGAVREDLIFGLENGMLGPVNALRVSLYPQGGSFRGAQQMAKAAPVAMPPVDVLEGEVRLGQTEQAPPRSVRGVVSATLDLRVFPGQPGRGFEVRIASGPRGVVAEKRDVLNRMPPLSFGPQPLVALLRPPLDPKGSWSLVVGARDDKTGRVQTLFSEGEASRLRVWLAQAAPARLGPLDAKEFAVVKLPLAVDEVGR